MCKVGVFASCAHSVAGAPAGRAPRTTGVPAGHAHRAAGAPAGRAHAQGIIHRDLKPANILIDRSGHAFVTDFGLARDTSRASDLTGSGDVLGTPAYMAPEQANGETGRIGEATDVHALGVILYEMLTGSAPYGHGAPAEVLARLLRDEPTALRTIDRRIPRDLETICLKAIAKAPEGRYATVHAFLEDLRRFEAGQPILARGPNPLRHVVRFARAHWKLAAVAVVAAAATATFAHRRLEQRHLFDEMNAAETVHGSGNHLAAILLFQGLYVQTEGEWKEPIFQRMVRCAGELGTSEEAVEAWERVVSLQPDRSFGEADGAAARTLVAELKRKHTLLKDAANADPAGCERAAKRLRIFLAGTTGTTPEREAAQNDLGVIVDAQHATPDTPLEVPLEVVFFPKGTIDQLQKQADDVSDTPWRRGYAAFAAARSLEAAGNTSAAKVRLHQSCTLLQSTFPIYSCPEHLSNRKGTGWNAFWYDNFWQCHVVVQADTELRRLEPSEPAHLRGGLVFHLTGDPLPKGLVAAIDVSPCTTDVEKTARILGNWRGHHRASLTADHPARVGVCDGRWRLAVGAAESSFETDEAARLAEFYVLELDGMPADVVIDGAYVEMPPVRVRRLAEITLLSPDDGARVDLNQDVFRWTPVQGSSRYDVLVTSVGEEKEGSTSFHVTNTERVETPLLCYGDPGRHDIASFASSLSAGTMVEWTVDALDGTGRVIGVSSPKWKVLVARALGK